MCQSLRIPSIVRSFYRFAIAIATLAGAGVAHAQWRMNFPDPVTPIAHETLHIHNLFMWIISTMFVIVFAIMVYSMVKHRKSVGHRPADFVAPKSKAQWLWTLVPFAILLFIDYVIFGVPAYKAVLSYEDTRQNAQMVVKVTGLQWKWQYEYPREGVKFVSSLTTPQDQIDNKAGKGEHYLLEVDNPLVIPVGKKIRFITTSNDVIHSWWVPSFGVKRDSIPGFLREFWAQVDTPGVYRGQCAELCGKDHGFMPIVVRVVSEPEYNQWMEAQKIALAQSAQSADRQWSMDELMKHGAEVYKTQCLACHQDKGQGMPPAFPALAGSALIKNVPMLSADGKLVKDGHIDRVMFGKAGTAMQAFAQTLSDVDIAAVITYERNSWGNNMGDLVQPAAIKALRK